MLHRYAMIWVIEKWVVWVEKLENIQVDFSQEKAMGNKEI